MNLSEIKKGLSLTGLEPNLVCTIVSADEIDPNAFTVIYRLPDGQIKERLLSASEADSIAIATAERPFSFDGDGETFKLVCEAKRIDLAFLFDPMMAVHTSNVDPLPHQITAVYESMLPKQPLRYVLADDPGAGKTIMAGLYIRELLMRADSKRILIVAPGSLVEQWRDELYEKFGLEFKVFSGIPEELVHHQQLIVRLDQVSRDEEGDTAETKRPGSLQARILGAQWDLVVFDEAHKLGAHYNGQKISKTARFRFAERIGKETRHLLLMTATPHNGKEEDFQLFLSLLDSDRFYGKFREGAHQVDTTDIMRRMVKEELVKFDNRPLFPERKAYTVNYSLSEAERQLYENVTRYVQEQMGKADALADGSRRTAVGFALTALQRRLASSPEAIYKSLERRKKRLSDRLREDAGAIRGPAVLQGFVMGIPEDEDEIEAEQLEALSDQVVDQATAAGTRAELEIEIRMLSALEEEAKRLVATGQDRKWEELKSLLQDNPAMHDADQRLRKIIIFTEHRDTLAYLEGRISRVLGNQRAIVTIHGGTSREDRRRIQGDFRSDPEVRVLIATDAAGEGVNLQCANLMVNYDLPWNPNRLEQRFGRIHRIGQTEVCHLWSLVAKETREGDVWQRLLDKIAVECEALKGKVFNILGDVFEEESLRDLMLEAIKYGDRPEVRRRLLEAIDHAFDHEKLKSLLNRNALAEETLTSERVYQVKEEMEKAEARKLQPHFIQSFFLKAFTEVGGDIRKAKGSRFEIKSVPGVLLEADRKLRGRNPRQQEPVLRRYELACFDRNAIQLLGERDSNRAVLIHPGHPLMLSLIDHLTEKNLNLLKQGAVLMDPLDEGSEPWVLMLLTHEVRSGDGTVLSKRIQFMRVNRDGTVADAGSAPHLSLEVFSSAHHELSRAILEESWLKGGIEKKAVAAASSSLAVEHFDEVRYRRVHHIDKTLRAVNERLRSEIDYWTDKQIKLSDDQAAGRDVRLQLDNVKRTIQELGARLGARRAMLNAMREVQNTAPVSLGAALVIPKGLIRSLSGEGAPESEADAMARSKVERLAMEAVIRCEKAMGHETLDVSARKCGWDITSTPRAAGGSIAMARHIEVKGRARGADIITVSKNEILEAFNQGEKFWLAIVIVNPDDSTEGPYYIKNPFQKEPDFGTASVNYHLSHFLERAEAKS